MALALRRGSASGHFADREAWLEIIQRSLLRIGADLIAKAPVLYPNVEIIPDARKQIVVLSWTEKYFSCIVNGLESANREIVAAWTGGPFPHHKLTLKSPKHPPRLRMRRRCLVNRNRTNRSFPQPNLSAKPSEG